MNTTEINWQEIGAKLRAPFAPADVDFRPQGNPNGSGKAQAVCYIDARVVADRLDEVVGPGAWSFTYEPLVIDKGEVKVAKGRLTIHGITKEDVGESSNFDPSKGCVSDALKRAAVLWGIGRYLYGIGGEWVTLDQYKRIPAEVVERLRAKLPKPNGQPASQNAPTRAPQAQQTAVTQEVATQPTPTTRPAPPAVDAFDATPANRNAQTDLLKLLKSAGHDTPAKANRMINAAIGRTVNIPTLLAGESDLTMGEVGKIIQSLATPLTVKEAQS